MEFTARLELSDAVSWTPLFWQKPQHLFLASAAPTAPAEVTQPAPSRETTGKPETHLRLV